MYCPMKEILLPVSHKLFILSVKNNDKTIQNSIAYFLAYKYFACLAPTNGVIGLVEHST